MLQGTHRHGEPPRGSLRRFCINPTIAGLLGLVLAAFSSTAGLAQAPPAEVVAPEPESGEYIIGVEDRLSVSVWREPDLVRSVIVRPDGKITFPLLGDIQASGRSASELDTQITAALEKFVKEPFVSVIVEEINNFKIFLIGEVARQGEIILRRRTRLLQAIALAGGLTAYADKSKVTIIREENGREVRINIDYRRVASGERPESNIFLKPGDTIVAN